jgi:hypothetical protein
VPGGISMQEDANLPAQWAKEDTSHLETTGTHGDLDDLSQPILIYNDRRQAISKLNRRMAVLAPLIALYTFFIASMQLYWVAFFLIAQTILLYLWVVRHFNKTVTPLMKVDASGITIHGLVNHVHIDWDNLKEVRAYTFVYKFVGIDAKNIWKLQATLPMKIFLAYNLFVLFFYRLVGIRLSGINIPEQYSHFKAEEICEQIEKRRERYVALTKNTKSLTPQNSEQLIAATPDSESKPAELQSESQSESPPKTSSSD